MKGEGVAAQKAFEREKGLKNVKNGPKHSARAKQNQRSDAPKSETNERHEGGQRGKNYSHQKKHGRAMRSGAYEKDMIYVA